MGGKGSTLSSVEEAVILISIYDARRDVLGVGSAVAAQATAYLRKFLEQYEERRPRRLLWATLFCNSG